MSFTNNREPGLSNHSTSIGEYHDLIARSRFIADQNTLFSNRLSQVTIEDLFARDEYGRVELRPDSEVLAGLKITQLSDFGQALRHALAGRTMLDLGCGNPKLSRLPALIAQSLDARQYIGIDKNLPKSADLSDADGRSVESRFPVQYVHSDMLAYLTTLSRSQGTCFYLAGLEPLVSHDEPTQQYIHACLNEMDRIAEQGDSIVIGLGTHDFKPDTFGFQLTYTATAASRSGYDLTTHQIFTMS